MVKFIRDVFLSIRYFFNTLITASKLVGKYDEAEEQYKKDLADGKPDAKKIYDAKIKEIEKQTDKDLNKYKKGEFTAYHEFVEENERESRSHYESKPVYSAPEKTDADDALKKKGDSYERFIGVKFEEKGDLVIYSGFIYGYKDQGVDIIVVSPKEKVINLIQCKNWTNKQIEVEHVQDIYKKIDNYNWNFIYTLQIETIKEHHTITVDKDTIWDMLYDLKEHREEFKIRKTLYVASDKVMSLDIGKNLSMIKPNIFRYEDMKIVVQENS